MWKELLNWTLDFLKGIGDFLDYLFTPININVLTKTATDNIKDMNKLGLSNWPTWLADAWTNVSEPIWITPIEILSVSTITMLIAIFFIKKIVK